MIVSGFILLGYHQVFTRWPDEFFLYVVNGHCTHLPHLLHPHQQPTKHYHPPSIILKLNRLSLSSNRIQHHIPSDIPNDDGRAARVVLLVFILSLA